MIAILSPCVFNMPLLGTNGVLCNSLDRKPVIARATKFKLNTIAILYKKVANSLIYVRTFPHCILWG